MGKHKAGKSKISDKSRATSAKERMQNYPVNRKGQKQADAQSS